MFIRIIGQGPDLVMLHGWSMHSGVWHQFADLLSEKFTLHLVDLPGHGQSEWQAGGFELATLIEQLKHQLPEQAYWLGWSLGGLVATAFANKYPDAVEKLTLLASTPLFVQKQDWLCAVEASVFQLFADNLDTDQQQTLKRFLLLQARGAEQSKETIRLLAEDLASANPPHQEALKEGLDILLNSDFRTVLASLTCPVQILLGERDTLIPVTMMQQAKMLNPQITAAFLPQAGHAPFISQPKRCAELVSEFINA